MKTLLPILLFAALTVQAQTNKLFLVNLPRAYHYQIPFNGPKDDSSVHFLCLSADWYDPTGANADYLSKGAHWELKIKNFPFIRTQWTFEERLRNPGYAENYSATDLIIKPKSTINCYAVLNSAITNYNTTGQIIGGTYVYTWTNFIPPKLKSHEN